MAQTLSRVLTRAVVLGLGLLVMGCGGVRVRPVLPAALPSSDRLLSELEVRRTAVDSLRSFAEVNYESEDDILGSRHAVLAERPDRFRLEVLSAFGSLALMVSNGPDLAVYVRRDATVYRGSATPLNVATYTGVPLRGEDVVGILLGAPPHRVPTGVATVIRDEEAGLIRLAVPVVEGTQNMWFESGTLDPIVSLTPLRDGRVLRVSFGDYEVRGPVRFPFRIDVEMEPGEGALHLEYGSPSLNTEIADHLFRFPPRPGVEELRIDQYPTAESAS